MEFRGETFLYTLAGLMITFAGFSALLLALRPAAGAKLSLLDRYLAKTVMTYIFVLTAAALCRRYWRSTTFRESGFGEARASFSGCRFTALTIDFFAVVFGFVMALDIIMQQPMELSGQPPPR